MLGLPAGGLHDKWERRARPQQEETPVLEHWGHRKVVILRMQRKRTTPRKKRQPLNPKRVTAWAGAVLSLLAVVKLLVEIIKLIFLP